MNGRVYDPLVGRFMSADPYIQAPYNLKSFNRYSYAWNNPLQLTDPTGFEADDGGYDSSYTPSSDQARNNAQYGTPYTPSYGEGSSGGGSGSSGGSSSGGSSSGGSSSGGGGSNVPKSPKTVPDTTQPAQTTASDSGSGGNWFTSFTSFLSYIFFGAEAHAQPDKNFVRMTANGGGQVGRTGLVKNPNNPIDKAMDNLENSGALPKNVHGNSKESTKPQKQYDIVDTQNENDVVKTGITGGDLRKNGNLPRGTQQANAFNKLAGEPGQYQVRVVDNLLANGSEALASERARAAQLRLDGNSMNKHKFP
jgi:hypothetical protein